jgi:hypothetical protein
MLLLVGAALLLATAHASEHAVPEDGPQVRTRWTPLRRASGRTSCIILTGAVIAAMRF